jgi:hypothetical protein
MGDRMRAKVTRGKGENGMNNVRLTNGEQALKPVGTIQAAAVTAAQTLCTVPAGATCGYVNANTNACNVTVDGTTPTTTVGIAIPANTGKWWSADALRAAQVVSLSGTSDVSVQFFA